MTLRPLQVDDTLLGQHHYLERGDQCYYLGDYFPGEGYTGGGFNDLILNLKKPVDRRGRPEYAYKERAIAQAAAKLMLVLSKDLAQNFSFVPVPPSRVKDDPLYDDRLVQVLGKVRPAIDVRDVIQIRENARAHHDFADGERRPTPDDAHANLRLDQAALAGAPLKQGIVIFDDILTSGTHFKACQRLLSEHRADLGILGLFIGRRKVATSEIEWESFGRAQAR